MRMPITMLNGLGCASCGNKCNCTSCNKDDAAAIQYRQIARQGEVITPAVSGVTDIVDDAKNIGKKVAGVAVVGLFAYGVYKLFS